MIQDVENGHSLAIGLEPEAKRLSGAEFQSLRHPEPEEIG
jgi:hypothetical protein